VKLEALNLRNNLARQAVGALLALGLAGRSAAAVELSFEPAAPTTHIMNQAVVLPWARDVERLTSKRVRIKVPTWDLAPADQMYDLVRRGFADGGYQSVLAHSRYAPLMRIAALPLIHDTAEASAVALWRTYTVHFQDKRQYEGVKLLGFFCGAGSDVYSFREPIASVEGLRRLRIASAAAGTTIAMSWLGASVTAVSLARIQESLAGETFDALTGVSIGDVVRLDIASRVRSATVIPGKVHAPAYALFLNSEAWRKLPERDKSLIGNVAGESLARRSRAWDRSDDEFARKLPAGKPVITAPPQFVGELARAWRPIHEEWIADANRHGVDGEAALEFYISQVKGTAPGAKERPPPADRPGRPK
jgi:TRAP-type C4-dicarboxylate transport system substrate-binding protein